MLTGGAGGAQGDCVAGRDGQPAASTIAECDWLVAELAAAPLPHYRWSSLPLVVIAAGW
jgi:hypothetical protein